MNGLLLASQVIQEVTLGNVLVCITFIVGLVTGIRQFKNILKDWVILQLKPELEPINRRLAELEKRSDKNDIENCKNYLVMFLANVERGAKPDEVELSRFEEQYKYYTNKGYNSYVHKKYEKLKAEGKL